jgi:hypothetical protein
MIYMIADGRGRVKIGRSSDVDGRLRGLQSSNSCGLKFLRAIEPLSTRIIDSFADNPSRIR